MRKIFIWITIYLWGLTNGIPILYRIFMGEFPKTYSVVSDCPDGYMLIAMLIMIIYTGLVLLLITVTPGFEKKKRSYLSVGDGFYYVVMISYIISFLMSSGGNITELRFIRNASEGATLGSILSILLNAQVLFVVFALREKEILSVAIVALLYLVYTFIWASRAGALFIGVVLVCYILKQYKEKDQLLPAERKTKRSQKRTLMLLLTILAILSPMIFVLSTNNRGGHKAGNTAHQVVEQIAGRCSNIELDGIMLYQKDSQRWREDVFEEKYGLSNQIKQSINTLVPGNIFKADAYPNQYYRTVVGYTSLSESAKYYSSMCMTLPTYMVIKYGYVLGMGIAVLITWIFYLVCIRLKSFEMGVCFAIIVYQSLVLYFDWVMFTNSVKNVVFTLLVVQGIQYVLNRISVPKLKRIKLAKARLVRQYGRD